MRSTPVSSDLAREDESMATQNSDRRYTRRALLRSAGILAVGVAGATSLLAACAPAPAAPAPTATTVPAAAAPPAPAAATAAPTAAPAAPTARTPPTTQPPPRAPAAAAAPTGGKLTAAVFLEPGNLDPAQQVWVPGIVILKNVIETLIDLDDQGQAHPRLASSWDVADEGTSWTWHLRDDV